jgi:hypothetical protein
MTSPLRFDDALLEDYMAGFFGHGRFGEDEQTVYVVIQHPTGRGVTNAFLDKTGRFLAERMNKIRK